jgi:hypothetical protein
MRPRGIIRGHLAGVLMRSLRFLAVLWLLLCVLLTNAVAQQTDSAADIGLGNGGKSCRHDSGFLSGPTHATCSSSYSTEYFWESGVSGASANYSGLAIAGNSTAEVFDPGFDASATAAANAELIDWLFPTDFPSGSFLFVAYGLVASPTGSSRGQVTAGASLQPKGGKTVDCTIDQFGRNSCAAQVGINTGDSVQLTAYLSGVSQVSCDFPCDGASGFEAGYKAPGGASVLLAAIVDGKGNRVKNAKITSASGHRYPSKFASTTKLKSHPNPSTQGQPVKFTATVSSFGRSGAPTGKVTFTDRTTGTTLGHATLKAGVATLRTSALPSGSHAIVAAYGGDIWSAWSQSAALNQVVN